MLVKFIYNDEFLFITHINCISDLNILDKIIYYKDSQINFYKIQSIQLVYDDVCGDDILTNKICEPVYYFVILINYE